MDCESYILAVGTDSSVLPLSQELRGGLCAMVRHCPDVFRALARIGRDPLIRGVIVDLSAVNPSHMEFFSLVGRVQPDLAVYVASGLDTARQRVGEAIDLGATGELTDSAAATLMASCRANDRNHAGNIVTNTAGARCAARPASPVEKQSPVQQVDVSLIASDERAASPVITNPPVDPEGESPVPQEPGDRQTTETARVPWLRYTDAPGRKKPGAARQPPVRRPPEVEQSDPVVVHPPHEEHEPLLTDEELAALLGDDGPDDSPGNAVSDVEGDEGEPGAIR